MILGKVTMNTRMKRAKNKEIKNKKKKIFMKIINLK